MNKTMANSEENTLVHNGIEGCGDLMAFYYAHRLKIREDFEALEQDKMILQSLTLRIYDQHAKSSASNDNLDMIRKVEDSLREQLLSNGTACVRLDNAADGSHTRGATLTLQGFRIGEDNDFDTTHPPCAPLMLATKLGFEQIVVNTKSSGASPAQHEKDLTVVASDWNGMQCLNRRYVESLTPSERERLGNYMSQFTPTASTAELERSSSAYDKWLEYVHKRGIRLPEMKVSTNDLLRHIESLEQANEESKSQADAEMKVLQHQVESLKQAYAERESKTDDALITLQRQNENLKAAAAESERQKNAALNELRRKEILEQAHADTDKGQLLDMIAGQQSTIAKLEEDAQTKVNAKRKQDRKYSRNYRERLKAKKEAAEAEAKAKEAREAEARVREASMRHATTSALVSAGVPRDDEAFSFLGSSSGLVANPRSVGPTQAQHPSAILEDGTIPPEPSATMPSQPYPSVNMNVPTASPPVVKRAATATVQQDRSRWSKVKAAMTPGRSHEAEHESPLKKVGTTLKKSAKKLWQGKEQLGSERLLDSQDKENDTRLVNGQEMSPSNPHNGKRREPLAPSREKAEVPKDDGLGVRAAYGMVVTTKGPPVFVNEGPLQAVATVASTATEAATTSATTLVGQATQQPPSFQISPKPSANVEVGVEAAEASDAAVRVPIEEPVESYCRPGYHQCAGTNVPDGDRCLNPVMIPEKFCHVHEAVDVPERKSPLKIATEKVMKPIRELRRKSAPKCLAINASGLREGQRCGNTVMPGKEFCGLHKKYEKK